VSTTETATFETDLFLPHPPARVWRALTEPERLAAWWTTGEVAPVVGHEFSLDMGPWGQAPCKVLQVEPERLFAYSFTADWTLTWRLEAEGHGTRLFLTHAGFDLDSDMGRHAWKMMGPGWRDDVLPRLAEVLAKEPA
jgi:uncharacterized protein YndB with AHSA1/START domain